MDTLAFDYAIPAIRACSGLPPVRQCSCRAYNSKKGVAFVGMRHLFGMNATHEHGKWKLLSNEKNYFCNMKEIIETMPRIELALIIIGVFVLILKSATYRV